MKLVIASDHAGFPLKEDVRAYLAKGGHEVIDLGAYTVDPQDDYPDFGLVFYTILDEFIPPSIF